MSNKKLTYLIKNSKNIYFDIFPLKMSKNDPNVLKKKRLKLKFLLKKLTLKALIFNTIPNILLLIRTKPSNHHIFMIHISLHSNKRQLWTGILILLQCKTSLNFRKAYFITERIHFRYMRILLLSISSIFLFTKIMGMRHADTLDYFL